jgi:phosphoribosylformimino-5-aminoimidazole carboxamide ribotide isomerase
LGADVKKEKIVVHGWTETTSWWIYDLVEKYMAKGITSIFCTDVAMDGKLEGPSTELYKNILAKFPQLQLVASGGVSTIGDLEALRELGCKGAIIGKAIYENRISLEDIRILNEN